MCLVMSYMKRHNSMASLLAGNLFHLSFYPTSRSSVSFHPFHLLLSQGCNRGLVSSQINLLITFKITVNNKSLNCLNLNSIKCNKNYKLIPNSKMTF